ncbi:SpoIIAA family protein [Spirosoma endophyticum]|uniref:STAS/SEC14 domain-containing protein n=1 Tax=Spirosoma endophyticum TaxID=662367 RepID=UPI000B85F5F0
MDIRYTIYDIRPLIDEVKRKVAQYPTNLRAYAEYISVGSISPKAFWEDLNADATYLSAFEKAAVVTDKEWVGSLAKLGNLFPGLTIQVFLFSEREQAIDWISQ